MELKLSENIRRMRKERSLTQEAMADALGVTVGAVYKWESGLSSPELVMLVRIADLFDTSVDTLLGYEVAENRKKTITDRIYGYIGEKDRSGQEDVERALSKYPNDFGIIMAAANFYSAFGTEDRNKAYIRRAIELYNKASRIVPHDIDPKYGKTSIIGNMAFLHFLVDDKEQALTMLKDHNEGGVFNTKIAWLTAMKGDKDESCRQLLISGFWEINSELIILTFGLMIYYIRRGELSRARTVSEWFKEYMDGIRKSDDPCFFDKMKCICLVADSYTYFRSGEMEKADELLRQAMKLGDVFDNAPHHKMDIVKLFDFQLSGSNYSLLGESAEETVENTIDMIGDRKFSTFRRNFSE